ncbi:MAG: hypothetical protein OXE45_13105 [bacterium]|nr:hypothetical protein [bacterium]
MSAVGDSGDHAVQSRAAAVRTQVVLSFPSAWHFTSVLVYLELAGDYERHRGHHCYIYIHKID